MLKLTPRADAELSIDLPQVVVDSVRTDEQLCCDLGVRSADRSEPGDVRLLRRELVSAVDSPLPRGFSSRRQLDPGAFPEVNSSHRVEHLECSAQRLAGIATPTDSTEPLAVHEASSRHVRPGISSLEEPDRFEVQLLGRVIRSEQSLCPCQ